MLVKPRFPDLFQYLVLEVADTEVRPFELGPPRSESARGLGGLLTHASSLLTPFDFAGRLPSPPDLRPYQDQNLIRLFPSTCDWIARAIAGGGTVLVHCSGGIALAPSIVCGYVMLSQRWTFEEAVRWTQQRRYCMSLNIVREACNVPVCGLWFGPPKRGYHQARS